MSEQDAFRGLELGEKSLITSDAPVVKEGNPKLLEVGRIYSKCICTQEEHIGMHDPHKVRRECMTCIDTNRVSDFLHEAAALGGQLECMQSLSCPSNQRLDQESGKCALKSNNNLHQEKCIDVKPIGRLPHLQSTGSAQRPENLSNGPWNSQQVRSKSTEKVEKIGINQTTSTHVLACEHPPKKQSEIGNNFLEYEYFPSIRTRVITSSSDKTKVIEGRKEEKRAIQRNLTDLLDEVNNSYDRMETAEEDEEFNFEKEAEKCQEQLSLFSDAYVLDMSECNLESDSRNASANLGVQEVEELKKPDESEPPSTFKKLVYFTSVAATTGFYFLMRKHNLL